MSVYQVSPVKRRRATQEEMEVRAAFLIDYAEKHGPVTVRGLYYQAEVAGLPGIDKTENGYNKVQEQILNLRRTGRLSYSHITDATRWMRKPRSYSSVEEMLRNTARTYRKALWIDTEEVVEIWVEKGALAGVILPITAEYDVPLMPCVGYTSETFAWGAVEAHEDETRPVHIYYLGDFDRAGLDGAKSLREKLFRFGDEAGVEFAFEQIAVNEKQIKEWRLPTRLPKRNTVADQKWPYDYACELDALDPDAMRALVRDAIERHLPADQLRILKIAEESERRFLRELAA